MQQIEVETRFEQNVEERIIDFLNESLSFLEHHDIDVTLIDKLIVTHKYDEVIQELNGELGRSQSVWKGRSFEGVLKSLFNFDFDNPKYVVVIRDSIFQLEIFRKIIFEEIIGLHSAWLIPESLIDNEYNYSQPSFSSTIEVLLAHWLPLVFKVDISLKLGCSHMIDKYSRKQIFNDFKRRIKKIHLNYQSSLNLDIFWTDLLREIDRSIRFFLQQFLLNETALDEAVDPILKELFDTIKVIKQAGEDYGKEMPRYTTAVLSLLEWCYVNIEQDQPFKVKIKAHPKYLFKDNLLDTSPCIVGFTDILGFGSIVEDYERDSSVNTLERLYDALDFAVEKGIRSLITSEPYFSDLFDYRLFSDCLAVSMPYYDNDEDFTFQLGFICQILNFYQLTMLSEQFFIRGAITYGNHYSDNHMIFSSGLVKAYLLESKNAIYPRIILDPRILERIGRKAPKAFSDIGIAHKFVVERNSQDFVFLNPFGTLQVQKQNSEVLSSPSIEKYQHDDMFSLSDKAGEDLIKLTRKFRSRVNDDKTDPDQFMSILLDEVHQRINQYRMDDRIRPKYEWFEKFLKYNLGENNEFELYFEE